MAAEHDAGFTRVSELIKALNIPTSRNSGFSVPVDTNGKRLAERADRVRKVYVYSESGRAIVVALGPGLIRTSLVFEDAPYTVVDSSFDNVEHEHRVMLHSHSGRVHLAGFNALPRHGAPLVSAVDYLLGLECRFKSTLLQTLVHVAIQDEGSERAFRD